MNHLVYVNNKVVRGFGRGSRELGCPTANVEGANSVQIPTGIYCGLAQLVIRNEKDIQPDFGADDSYKNVVKQIPYVSPVRGMVSSFGFNPHYGNTEKSLEVHILDNFPFNFYGAELRVLICKKMRNEEKYNNLEELKEAISNDKANASREVLNYVQHSNNREYFLEPSGTLSN